MTSFAQEVFLAGVLFFVLKLLERECRLLVALDQLLRIARRYQLLEEVHFDRRDLVNIEHIFLTSVPIRALVSQFIVELEDDFD